MKSSPLLFVSQLKSYMNEEEDFVSQDLNLKTAIDVTTSLAESICGRVFLRQEVSEQFRSVKNYSTGYSLNFTPIDTPTGEHFRRLVPIKVYLKHTPISDAHPVKVYYSETQEFTTELPSTYYTVDYNEGTVLLRFPMEDAHNAIKVTYTGGYADSVDVGVTENLADPTQERSVGRNIPADLRHAALVQAYSIYSQIQTFLCDKDNNNNTNNFGTSFLDTYKINPAFSMLLYKYRRPNVRFV